MINFNSFISLIIVYTFFSIKNEADKTISKITIYKFGNIDNTPILIQNPIQQYLINSFPKFKTAALRYQTIKKEVNMALKQVARYYSRWDLNNHHGRIALYDSGNRYLDNREYKNPEEFQVIVGMLRNEKPLWFDSSTRHLRTGYGSQGEPTGEEEDS